MLQEDECGTNAFVGQVILSPSTAGLEKTASRKYPNRIQACAIQNILSKHTYVYSIVHFLFRSGLTLPAAPTRETVRKMVADTHRPW